MIEQQYYVVLMSTDWVELDWGLDQRASWAMHGSVHGPCMGQCMGQCIGRCMSGAQVLCKWSYFLTIVPPFPGQLIFKDILIPNHWKKVNNNHDSLPIFIQMKFFVDKKKYRKLSNIQPSFHFYGMIIWVKTKPLCIGMALLPFQKFARK